MLVTLYFSGRPAGTIDLRARDGIVETAGSFDYAFPAGAHGSITNHPHTSLSTPSSSNELALEPNARYLISMRTSGAAAAGSRLTLSVLQYSADALIAKARTAFVCGTARLVLGAEPALRGTSVVLYVTGSGSLRVDACRVYPLEASAPEVESWVEAAANEDDALDLAALIRAQRPQRTEDKRYRFRRIAARLRPRIESFRDRSAQPASLDAAAARMAMLEGDFRAARELWLRVLENDPASRDKVMRSLADCEIRLGDVESGYRRLLALKDASPDNARLKRHLARALARVHRVQHQHRAARILERRRSREPLAWIRELYAGTGLGPDQAERIARLWADFERTAETLLDGRNSHRHGKGPDRAADLDGIRAVTTTGFGWSGSGAVNDWLREFASVEMPLGKSESAVIGNSDEMPVAASLLRLRVSAPRQLVRTIAALVRGRRGARNELRQLAGALSPRRSRRELYHALEAVVLHTVLAVDERGLLWHAYTDPGTFDAFSDAFERFVAELRTLPSKGSAVPGEIVGALSRLLLRTAVAKAEDSSRLLLFNNLVRGVDFPLLRFIPHLRSIAVFRDPRDQYTAWCTEGRGAPPVPEFVAHVRRVRGEFAAAMRQASVAERVIEVQFERFVTSDDYRARIADALELTESAAQPGRFFQPAVSAGNVGIYKQFADREAIRTIEKACEPWLYDAASF